jgi:metal-responsive CopG/Arc/MetJ family transcriptional regulator
MPTEKPRFTLIMDEKLLELIDDFRFENRYPSRSAAAIDLIRMGLKQAGKKLDTENVPEALWP